MNKQLPPGGIEWTRIYGRPGYTANPVRGCKHECRWEMPSGDIAICYAKSFKERMSGHGSFKNITWHPSVLADIRKLKEPSGIFIDSSSDLFGQGVKNEWIQSVIQTIAECPQHVFFSLTKNPSRFREFKTPWPSNWLAGISYPPTFMFGKRLTPEQQRHWFERGMNWLAESPAQKPWVSIEPLSLDLSSILRDYRKVIKWAVIGAATNGAATHQPAADVFANTLDALIGIPVFFKSNLSRTMAEEVAGGWREEFPKLATAPAEDHQPEML